MCLHDFCICVHVASEEVLLSAATLDLSSTELTTRLNDTLTRCQEELHKVEEISTG